jgi:hypothetical protein
MAQQNRQSVAITFLAFMTMGPFGCNAGGSAATPGGVPPLASQESAPTFSEKSDSLSLDSPTPREKFNPSSAPGTTAPDTISITPPPLTAYDLQQGNTLTQVNSLTIADFNATPDYVGYHEVALPGIRLPDALLKGHLILPASWTQARFAVCNFQQMHFAIDLTKVSLDPFLSGPVTFHSLDDGSRIGEASNISVSPGASSPLVSVVSFNQVKFGSRYNGSLQVEMDSAPALLKYGASFNHGQFFGNSGDCRLFANEALADILPEIGPRPSVEEPNYANVIALDQPTSYLDGARIGSCILKSRRNDGGDIIDPDDFTIDTDCQLTPNIALKATDGHGFYQIDVRYEGPAAYLVFTPFDPQKM